MKVFISWSGPRSLAVAEALHDFIGGVLQSTQPWVSKLSIDHGTPWFARLKKELGDASTGIVCLTQRNKKEPWLLFEAGAIAKLERSRAYTLLIDLQHSDVTGPLAQFQHTGTEEAEIRKLLEQINSHVPKKSQTKAAAFDSCFKALWPGFLEKLDAAKLVPEMSRTPPTRTIEDMVREILGITRGLETTLASERRMEYEPFAGFGSAPAAPVPITWQGAESILNGMGYRLTPGDHKPTIGGNLKGPPPPQPKKPGPPS